MARFRKITVNGNLYEWHYSFDDYDWQMPSQLVIRTLDRTTKLILYFCSEDNGIGHCPFNRGVKAVKDGKEMIINLNQPKFIAEIINCLFVVHTEYISSETKCIKIDGLKILRSLGYQFEYSYG